MWPLLETSPFRSYLDASSFAPLELRNEGPWQWRKSLAFEQQDSSRSSFNRLLPTELNIHFCLHRKEVTNGNWGLYAQQFPRIGLNLSKCDTHDPYCYSYVQMACFYLNYPRSSSPPVPSYITGLTLGLPDQVTDWGYTAHETGHLRNCLPLEITTFSLPFLETQVSDQILYAFMRLLKWADALELSLKDCYFILFCEMTFQSPRELY